MKNDLVRHAFFEERMDRIRHLIYKASEGIYCVTCKEHHLDSFPEEATLRARFWPKTALLRDFDAGFYTYYILDDIETVMRNVKARFLPRSQDLIQAAAEICACGHPYLEKRHPQYSPENVRLIMKELEEAVACVEQAISEEKKKT